MKFRRIGDRTVSAIGLGAMWLSMSSQRPSDAEAIRVIHTALDAGVRLIDTADNYGRSADEFGHNERLVSKALRTWGSDTSEVIVATKGGHVLNEAGEWAVDGRPEYIKTACDRSRQALGVDTIDLYFYHRPDTSTPWEETIGAFAELRRQGKIRLVGLSNVSGEQILRALEVTDVAAVQNEFSPGRRSSLGELELCGELSIAFMPWRPLGGTNAAPGMPSPCPAFTSVATRHGVTPQQVALAWELHLGGHVVPIPGARRAESILDSLKAVDLALDPDDLEALNVPCTATEDEVLPPGLL